MSWDAQSVKEAADICVVVGEHVCLRRVRSSGRYVGLCPFHQEKTPSFHVSQDHQSYRCFGCGASGDVFTFAMAIEGLSFSDAVNMLGARLGIASRQWTSAESSRYARAAIEARVLAARLADFAHGLELAIERPLRRLRDALESVGLDSTETLAHLHRRRYLLAQVTPRDITKTFREMLPSNSEAVNKIESLGREDRKNAEMVTRSIVEVLAMSQRAEVVS